MLFYHTGSKHVVVGDLVYSEGDNTEKEMTCVNSECEDENLNDADDCGQLDEVSATNLPVA